MNGGPRMRQRMESPDRTGDCDEALQVSHDRCGGGRTRDPGERRVRAAGRAGWRVVFSQRGLVLGGGLGGLATTGPGNAWAVGFAIAAGGPHSVVLQWKT